MFREPEIKRPLRIPKPERNFGFREMQDIFWQAEELLASQNDSLLGIVKHLAS
jgi:hypothetical protein